MKLVRLACLVALFMALAVPVAATVADPVTIELLDMAETPGSMTLTLNVVDESGRHSELTNRNFESFINSSKLNVTQVETLEATRRPASIVLVVDTSGSMYGQAIVEARNAIREFIGQLEPSDEVALYSFSTGVRLLQDFTSDRSLLDAAVSNLEAFGDTALYDAVSAGIAAAEVRPLGGRLVVLLSDGVATIGEENRDASLQLARQSSTSIVAVGLGPSVDVNYLDSLAEASGGAFIQAETPQGLRSAYAGVSASIKRPYASQYRVSIDVPPHIDRTIEGSLRIQATVRADKALLDVPLGILPGATPPPFEIRLAGLEPGAEVEQAVTVTAAAFDNRPLSQIEYQFDEGAATPLEAGSLSIDPAKLTPGDHTLIVRAVDAGGSRGEANISFFVVEPPPVAESGGGAGLPILPVLVLLVAGVAAYFAYRMVQRRLSMAPEYVTAPLAARGTEPAWATRRDEPAEPAPARKLPKVAVGRVVVMNERDIQSGDLATMQEYDIFDVPLTIGQSDDSDIQLADPSGLIAAEEAKIWVQRGRLVYHRLTTLSAMATEGVTAGWQFLDPEEEMKLGPYRLRFILNDTAGASATEPAAVINRPQEHGMTLQPFGQRNHDYDDLPEPEAEPGV